ncbi:MAG TPA: TonB-dependent receptor plug domain-containing protein [Vicinamibacterales bacterium]|jgi:iron complex outermembrane receptor protein/vitamin B12 transporter|nr:TonB-dependent receptor plug domain-containing protein [Vicinamibacterales bacterium]
MPDVRFKHFLMTGLSAVLALAMARPAFAQPPATITGVVLDLLGAPVSGASITLAGANRPRATKSASDGSYSFDNVAGGRYQVLVTQPGFQPFSSEPVYVGAGAKQTIDATLQVSPLQQSVVVTAAATEISQAQTGAPVTVIDSATLDALNTPDVLEVLRLVPGAQIVQAGGRGGATSLFIRGGESDFNKVLIDGAVANDIGGGFDFSPITTVGIDRVEVMRQTNSVMYGSDTLAGVVNITTKRGQTRVPELTLAADGGNLGTWSGDTGLGGVIQRFNYYSGFRKFETNNDVPNNVYHNGTYAGRFGVTLGSNSDVSGTVRRVDSHAGSPNGITLYGLADDSRSEGDQTFVSVNSDTQFTNRLQATVRYGFTNQNSLFNNPTPTGEPFDSFGLTTYLGNTVTLTGANGYTVTGRGILDFNGDYPQPFESHTRRNAISGESTFAVNNSLSVSGGARWEREEALQCFNAVGCLATMTDQERTDNTVHRTNGGAFVEGRGTIMNRHYISAGLGVEHNEVFGEAVTPRLSIASYLRQPSSTGMGDTKIVLNAGTGIKAPAVFQVQSSLYEVLKASGVTPTIDPIGPERSTSFDIGIEQGLADNRARIRASYFHNTFHDLIEFVDKTQLTLAGVPPAVVATFTDFGAYVNSQSYRAQGLELSFEEAPRTDVRVMASYTYLDAEVTKAFSATTSFNTDSNFPDVAIGAFSPLVGARPFRRPPHSAAFAVMYTPSRYEVALSAYFSGKRDDSTFISDGFFGNSMLLPNKDLDKAYQKVDLSGGVDVHPRLKVYASIENLLNQDYEASFGFPALPITARVGVKITVGGK